MCFLQHNWGELALPVLESCYLGLAKTRRGLCSTAAWRLCLSKRGLPAIPHASLVV